MFSCGRLAQLVEHSVYTGMVRGSSPLSPTRTEKDRPLPVLFVFMCLEQEPWSTTFGHLLFARRHSQMHATPPRDARCCSRIAPAFDSCWCLQKIEKLRRRLSFSFLCPQQESNLHQELRSLLLYPLSYGGSSTVAQVIGLGQRNDRCPGSDALQRRVLQTPSPQRPRHSYQTQVLPLSRSLLQECW